MTPTPPRFYIAESTSCIAVRDSLHRCVIARWYGVPTSSECPTCGHMRRIGVAIPDSYREAARLRCEEENEKAEAADHA